MKPPALCVRHWGEGDEGARPRGGQKPGGPCAAPPKRRRGGANLGFIYTINIPGCSTQGRLFVGQRKDPFVVNLGEIFDLVNLNPLRPENGRGDDLADKNVASLILELPIACIVQGSEPVLGGWTTASLRQAHVLNPKPSSAASGKGPSVDGGAWSQVSRLGSPPVNEVVIGLKDKDRFNASEPKDDAQFADYVTNPMLPALLQALFPSVTAPTAIPRTDLVAAFLTGVDGLNKPANVVASEMLRLNTSIAPKAKGSQSRLGVLGSDTAGFPNGRRPGDDVVDVELRAVMGALLPLAQAPSGNLPFTVQFLLKERFLSENQIQILADKKEVSCLLGGRPFMHLG